MIKVNSKQSKINAFEHRAIPKPRTLFEQGRLGQISDQQFAMHVGDEPIPPPKFVSELDKYEFASDELNANR